MLRIILIFALFLSLIYFLKVFFRSYKKNRPHLFGNRPGYRKYPGTDRHKAVEAEFEEIK